MRERVADWHYAPVISSHACTILCFNDWRSLTGTAYIFCFRISHTKKSNGVKSDEREGQATGPAQSIHILENEY